MKGTLEFNLDDRDERNEFHMASNGKLAYFCLHNLYNGIFGKHSSIRLREKELNEIKDLFDYQIAYCGVNLELIT